MCLLNKHNLGVARFANKPEVIQVTPKETIATDGVCLVRVSRPKEPPAENFPAKDGFKAEEFSRIFEEITGPVLIKAETALVAMKALPKKNIIPVLDFAALSGPDEYGIRKLVVTDLAAWQEFRVPEGKAGFPNIEAEWKRAIDAKFTISFDAERLRDLLDAVVTFRAGRKDSLKAVRISFYANDAAIRLDAHNNATGQQWTALLMPVWGADPEPSEPDFGDYYKATEQM